MADLTRRSFFAGMGSITVGFLFAKKLDRILGQLETESRAELSEVPSEDGQVASAAVITCALQQAFRPQRLVVRGKKIGTRMVPEHRFFPCEACVGKVCDDCDVCYGTGGEYKESGLMVEQDILHAPWIIEDISINRQSQFIPGGGGIPADLFAPDAMDTSVMMDIAGPGLEIRFRVRYTGDVSEGEVFQAALIGRSMDGKQHMLVLPVSSVERIRA